MRRIAHLGLLLCLFLAACGGSTPAARTGTDPAGAQGAVTPPLAALGTASPTATPHPTVRPTATPTPKTPTPVSTRPRPTTIPTATATAAPTASPTPIARLAVARSVSEPTARCSIGLPVGFADDAVAKNLWRSADGRVIVKLEAPVTTTASLDVATTGGVAGLQGALADFREVSRGIEGSARRVAFTGKTGELGNWGTLYIRQFGLDFCQVTVVATVGTTMLLDPLVETVSASLVAANVRPVPVGYLALGDSYAAGVGAADPSTGGYAARFASTLRGPSGEPIGLQNLAVPGATSADYLGDWPMRGPEGTSPLAGAVRAIGGGQIGVVTLDIGGNDILRLLKSVQPCADAAIESDACLAALRDALKTLTTPNLPQILGAIVGAAAPGTQILVLTYPNPFSTGQPNALEARTAPAMAELNALIMEAVRTLGPQAGARQVTLSLVDLAPPFAGQGGKLTHVLDTPPDIHPTDAGHAAIAEALVRAYRR